MFCPKYRYEYIPGVYKCHECEVDLVDGPPEGTKDEDGLVAIYVPGKFGDSTLVKAIFEQEGIEYFVFGQSYSGHRPLIQVKREDAERARQLLIDIANSRADEADGEGTKE